MMANVNSHHDEGIRMPTPERTSLAAIVEAARDLLETGGPAAITMQAVATRVGVRPPSLYKRVRDRDALLGLTSEATADDLAERLAASGTTLADYGRAYRAFAHAHPEGFRLLFSGDAGSERMGRAVQPVLRAARDAVGDEHALDAARLLTAWATGFLSMELAGAFRMGGDIDEAFEYGLERITASITAR
jgi:AcrR family transcriptional regulator